MTKNYDAILKRAFLEVEIKKLNEFDASSEESFDYSEDFIRRMNSLIKQRKKPYWKYINTAMKRVAVAVIAVIVLFSTSMSISAIREPVVDFFIKIYETFTGFFTDDENIKASDTIEKVYQITQLPDGYVLKNQSDNKVNVQTTWTNGNDILILSQTILKNNNIKLDTEKKEYSVKDFNGLTLYYTEQKNIRVILWLTSEYTFSIICSEEIGWNDIETIIKSIK